VPKFLRERLWFPGKQKKVPKEEAAWKTRGEGKKRGSLLLFLGAAKRRRIAGLKKERPKTNRKK